MTANPFELGTDGPTRILVGVDGSDTSMRAGAYAAGLARRQGAKLVVLHVRTTPAAATMAATGAAALRARDDLVEELRSELVEAARHLAIAWEFVVRSGNPYKALLEVAAELRVDAIVVGASTSAGHRIVGSLAARLVRDASWPVTVVP